MFLRRIPRRGYAGRARHRLLPCPRQRIPQRTRLSPGALRCTRSLLDVRRSLPCHPFDTPHRSTGARAQPADAFEAVVTLFRSVASSEPVRVTIGARLGATSSGHHQERDAQTNLSRVPHVVVPGLVRSVSAHPRLMIKHPPLPVPAACFSITNNAAFDKASSPSPRRGFTACSDSHTYRISNATAGHGKATCDTRSSPRVASVGE